MSDKKVRIKVSEIRALVRKAIGEASTITSRQGMITAGDDPDDKRLCDCNEGEHEPECFYGNNMKEVASDWEDTVKTTTKDPWDLASMKSKSEKSHKKESVEPVMEFRSFDDDFAEKLSDKKYEEMARQLYLAWSERGIDVDWAGVVNLYARNHSKNLATENDKTKLYEKVLNLVEKHLDAMPYNRSQERP